MRRPAAGVRRIGIEGRRLVPLAVVVFITLVTAPWGSLPALADELPFLRGMTVTCPRYGEIWGSGHMREALRELKGLGVDWVAIHPYAGVRRDGSMRRTAAANTGYLDRAIGIAREENVGLFWKPHLAYWGSFDWRGAIHFGDDRAAWERFFAGYREFILDHARFAQRAGIALLAVGVELEGTTHHEEVWRQLITEVRQVYQGRIVYAANWDQVARVPFWDAVDYIGVQAYFPLSHDPYPDQQALERGWREHIDQLRSVSRRHGDKPVLFTEIGYNRSDTAAREPWAYEVRDSESNRALRQRLMDVAFDLAASEPMIRGVFWWKWMPGSVAYSNFSMRDPEAIESLRRAWGSIREAPKGGAPAPRASQGP